MNISATAIIAALPLILAACVYDSDGPDSEPLAPTAPTAPDTRGGLRFTAEGATRVQTDMYESGFETGDMIGCIIASKNPQTGEYTYQANTSWAYAGGLLIPKKIRKNNGSWANFADNTEANPAPQGSIIARDCVRDPDHTEGFLTLTENFAYAFFFYYPFHDDADILASLKQMNAGDQLSKCNLPYAPVKSDGMQSYTQLPSNDWPKDSKIYSTAPNFLMTGEANSADVNANGSNGFNQYAWTAYPLFVCYDQNDGPQATTHLRANNSDWLYTNYTADRNDPTLNITKQTATYPVDLKMRKKMAAIEIITDEEFPYLTINNDNTAGVRTGTAIDLRTGKLTDYQPNTNWDATIFQKGFANRIQRDSYRENNKQYWHYDNYPLTPRLLGVLTDQKQHRRIILPPQDFTAATMTFRIPSKNKEYTVRLGDRLPRLLENKLYIVRITSNVDIDIIIRNWQDDQKGVLLDEIDT